MTQALNDFIKVLRAADVRISTAETIDAFETVRLMGYDDRALLKNSLGLVLAKTPEEKEAFDDAFDEFFSFRHFESPEAESSEESGQASADADGDDSGQQEAMPGGGQAAGGGQGDAQEGGEAPSLSEMLRNGDPTQLAMAMAQAARDVNLRDIAFFTQRGMYSRRIMERMGLDELNDEIIELERRGTEAAAAEAEALRQARDALREQVSDYVEQRMSLLTANAGRKLREEVLSQVKLSNLDRRDMIIMRELVRKMAKRLAAIHARRRKQARRGVLDVRRTIRHNVSYDGLLMEPVWKEEKIDRPKVMALCDVSGSVSAVARFLLMFLYSLTEVIPKIRAFAFSGELGDVTDLMERETVEKAIAEAILRYGGMSTDYGRTFADFEEVALGDVDHRTTVIILGDARSNYSDPRADILRKIYKRARRVIWLNPEPRASWGQGDSEMLRLAPYCHTARTCNSLKDIERVVNEILRTAA